MANYAVTLLSHQQTSKYFIFWRFFIFYTQSIEHMISHLRVFSPHDFSTYFLTLVCIERTVKICSQNKGSARDPVNNVTITCDECSDISAFINDVPGVQSTRSLGNFSFLSQAWLPIRALR